MKKPATSTKASLLKRTQGPNARPIHDLVECGAQTAQRISGHFLDFAQDRVQQIAVLMADMTPHAPETFWDALAIAVQDLRSASATCGHDALCRLAHSWERALDAKYRGEKKLVRVMQLHLDALRHVLSRGAGKNETGRLAGRLEALVASLTPAVEH